MLTIEPFERSDAWGSLKAAKMFKSFSILNSLGFECSDFEIKLFELDGVYHFHDICPDVKKASSLNYSVKITSNNFLDLTISSSEISDEVINEKFHDCFRSGLFNEKGHVASAWMIFYDGLEEFDLNDYSFEYNLNTLVSFMQKYYDFMGCLYMTEIYFKLNENSSLYAFKNRLDETLKGFKNVFCDKGEVSLLKACKAFLISEPEVVNFIDILLSEDEVNFDDDFPFLKEAEKFFNLTLNSNNECSFVGVDSSSLGVNANVFSFDVSNDVRMMLNVLRFIFQGYGPTFLKPSTVMNKFDSDLFISTPKVGLLWLFLYNNFLEVKPNYLFLNETLTTENVELLVSLVDDNVMDLIRIHSRNCSCKKSKKLFCAKRKNLAENNFVLFESLVMSSKLLSQ